MRPIDADITTKRIIDELRCVLFGQSGAFDELTGRQAANLIGKWIDEQPIIQSDAPRLMTMAELSGIYVEFKNDLIPMSLTHFDLGEIICYMQDGWCRLWSAKPSIEQREAAKWDE